ncbi:junctional adhesion molecule-like [Ctenodactylus gundi]
MFSPLKLILIPALLDLSLSLDDLTVSSRELTVHVGDSALMGCVFQITEEKRVTKVDWMLSSRERGKEEYVLYYYSNLSVPCGRFQNRVSLVGDIFHHDGSLLLQDVQEADEGTYTCEIRLERESMVFKKAVVLHVLPEEPKEIMLHVGDSALMRCVFHSTEEKHVTKIDWMFSSGQHTKEEVILRYNPKLNVPLRHSLYQGRFQNRVNLEGDVSRNDGSITLRKVKESDRGNYTCGIHLGSVVLWKTFRLRVIQEQPQTLATPATSRLDIFNGNHLVTVVGIVCATLLLLPVSILIVKKTHWNRSSESSLPKVKSLENVKKADLEKHVYSSIITREVTDEEQPSENPEATYMIMHPVRPSLRSDPDKLLAKSTGRIPKADQAF